MKAIRIFPRFLSLRGDWLLGWGVRGSRGERRWRGKRMVRWLEAELTLVVSRIMQAFILSAYTKGKEGEFKKNHTHTQCIPFGSCEGATGKDNNI